MNKIIKRPEYLPDTIEKLRDFILIGREKLKAYKAKLNAIKIVGFAKEVRDQSLSDAQDMATALLWAESRMGELLKTSRSGSFRKGGEKELPDGITHKQSHYAQQLANHPDIVEKIIDKALEEEEIPTRMQILREIQKPHISQATNEKKIIR